MILDTSALIAMLWGEPEAAALEAAVSASQSLLISAPTLLEAATVAEGRIGREMGNRLDDLLARIGVEIVPFTAEHAALAREGWRRYGKGRHPAGLNFGDCFAYALAKSRNEPLLFKGDHFAQTDVKAAI
ncbi:type II toxin-antitoxin system VapC family toxin [Roseococcus sp. YIM B11640]|uniref:type II toxin-antitoxin system VapC family toxin n=1 Tax=Roseococcus sp. YIM B11640 TaxID=3133973 RepID=UPI003C7C4A2A